MKEMLNDASKEKKRNKKKTESKRKRKRSIDYVHAYIKVHTNAYVFVLKGDSQYIKSY